MVVVGLQNPGEQYEHSRHNAGAIAVRHFCEAEGLPSFVSSAQYSGEISEGTLCEKDVRVLLPTTFMNNSGAAVKKATADSDANSLVVVYDDLDLPIGTFKISFGRGSGGHNGVQSVIDALGTGDFVRVRIGIAPVSFFGNMKRPTGEKVSDFVLKDFSKREEGKLQDILPEVTKAIRIIICEGKEKAMNRYN